jgi:hypothetical protein
VEEHAKSDSFAAVGVVEVLSAEEAEESEGADGEACSRQECFRPHSDAEVAAALVSQVASSLDTARMGSTGAAMAGEEHRLPRPPTCLRPTCLSVARI